MQNDQSPLVLLHCNRLGVCILKIIIQLILKNIQQVKFSLTHITRLIHCCSGKPVSQNWFSWLAARGSADADRRCATALENSKLIT